ncbi:hypothetical protein [Siminovitchia fordii]|uniref:Uncharacterized protein n=1 Tax=Siminovitchia fordii TaxID=254759 RepID=A0ABQ4K5J2_9BACI|nr:hypothetical protein [Siminovitchia fordii]GIN20994.1 hypothetical protein J1TS3_21280 [Siminovitchia fordii]
MSLPNIPDIKPDICLDRCEVIDLLLSSIAMEEIGLSHILNAEAEKLQYLLETKSDCLQDFWKINDSVIKTLRTIVKSQILLQFKLEDIIALDRESDCSKYYRDKTNEKRCRCKNNCCEKHIHRCKEHMKTTDNHSKCSCINNRNEHL